MLITPDLSRQIGNSLYVWANVSRFLLEKQKFSARESFLACSTRHSLESVQRQFWSLRRSKLLSVSATRQRNTLFQHNPPIIFSLERNSSWTTPCNGFLVVLKSQPLCALCCMAKPGGYVDHAGSVDNGRGHWQGRVMVEHCFTQCLCDIWVVRRMINTQIQMMIQIGSSWVNLQSA